MRKFKKAKWLVVLVVVAMLLALVPVVGVAGTEANPDIYTLYAGQNNDVGYLEVWDDGTKLYVNYVLDTDDFDAFTELHLAVAYQDGKTFNEVFSANGWVNRPGNPQIGQFPYKAYFDLEDGETEYEFEILLADIPGYPGDDLYIAAHAVVAGMDCVTDSGQDKYFSSTDVTVVESDNFETPFPAELAWVHPSWNSSLFHNGLGYDDLFDTSDGTSQWIWESNRVVNPIDGDVVVFEFEFDLPDNLTAETAGDIYIAADNAFAVYLNGSQLGVSPTWPGYPNTTNLTEEYVNSQGWQEIKWYALDAYLQEGTNILKIIAANEYMGPLDNQANGTIDSNPGGVIFRVDICWKTKDCTYYDDTAWAAKCGQPGVNRMVDQGSWATYVEYSL